MVFSRETYVSRRRHLRETMGEGVIVLFGNADSPINYPANAYHFRQDSTFMYYTGLNREGLVLVIDCDNEKEYLLGNDIDLDDIVWMGFTPSVHDLAESCGISNSGPMCQLNKYIVPGLANGSTHILPPYRYDNLLMLVESTGLSSAEIRCKSSLKLIKAVIDQRAVKTDAEIVEIEKACVVGYEMHVAAMRMCSAGVTEREIAGTIEGISLSQGGGFSFLPIVSTHGEIAHGFPRPERLEPGRLLLVDAGAETLSCYCSDNTRVTPVNGRFDSRQRDIYSIVLSAHDRVAEIARPGLKWRDAHFEAARVMTEGMKQIGLLHGDTDEILAAGAHAIAFTHGLGHMMGMDVHDMEGLGQVYVGFDEEVQPQLDQFGTNFLRCGRRLQPGFVMTDEPGLYFIPQLIDAWRAEGKFKQFINYDKFEDFKDFGGIRLEDDLLITEAGNRILGPHIPITIEEVEEVAGTGL